MKAASTLMTITIAGLMMSGDGAAAGRSFKLPPSTQRTLANGLRVLVMEYHELPLADFEIVVAAGAAHDPKGKEGLANLVADLLRRGTKTRSARQIADAVDFVGGSLGASADQDGTRVTAEFLSKDIELGLDLLADTLMNPAFSQEEVDRRKAETISELKAARENPGLLAGRRFVELLYRGHPYGHPTAGWESSVGSITRDDVLRFYQSQYAPDNVILVAVGDFKAEEMLARVESKLSGWKGKAAARAPVPEPKAPAGRAVYLAHKDESTQSQIRIGGVGIRRTDPDYPAVQVANTILGGGFTSRLMEEVRVNRSLSYSVSSKFFPLVQPGPFVISTFTKNPTTLETIEVALGVLEKFLKAGPTAEEVDKARRYIRGSFAIGHQSPDSLAGALAEIAFYGLPPDYYDTFLDRISAVTVADVKRVAAKIPAERSIILVLGEAEEVRKSLESLGGVQVVPLAEH